MVVELAAVRRNAAVLVVTAGLVLAGCGGGGNDDDDAGRGGAKGRVAPASSTTAPDDSAASATSTTGGGPATSVAGGPATPATTVASGAAAAASPQAAPATAALNEYLDALAAERYGDAMRVSTDGPRMLAFVRSLLKAFNETQGGRSTLTYTARSFTVATAAADRVAFSGRAALQTTTQAGERSGTSSAELTDPAVRFGTTWRVGELTLDRRPVTYHPSGREVRHPKAPLTLRIVGALNSGTSTAVVVELRPDSPAEVHIDEDALKYSTGARNSTVRLLSGSFAYFSYKRQDDRPTEWRAVVTVDGAEAVVRIPFS